jgi:multidrug efflux pump subunit AcrB
MSPERVEDLITRKLEEKIREIGEVEDIESDSKTGISIVHVIVHDEFVDLEPIWQDLRNKMSDIRSELPEGTRGPFVDDEFGLTAVATVALWSDGFSLAEMRDVARDLRDRLYSVSGVRKVELYGVVEEQVYLEVSGIRLSELGISPAVIVDSLRRQNVILPGGEFEVDGQNIVIEPSGNFDEISAIEAVPVPIPGTDQTVPLDEIATITRGYADPVESRAFFNGRQSIVLSVSVLEGVNAVEFGTRLTRRIRGLEGELPFGYFLDYATYQPDLVERAVQGAVTNVYQSLVIVLLVVVTFLGLRTGLIVGAFVPMTMLLGLIVMSLMGIELQRMSIAAMIIALGMLVDNGIVVAEDITTRMQAGEPADSAAREAGRTMAVPLLTASLTTILAFLPIALAEGGTGEYTLALGQVILVVLLGSWFLSMYMTPTLAAWYIRVTPGEAGDEYDGRFYRIYRRGLALALGTRTLTLAIVAGAFVAAFVGFGAIPEEFFPDSDRNQFLIYVDEPAGADVDATTRVVQSISEWLSEEEENPEVTGTIAYVATGGPRFFLSLSPLDPDPHKGFIIVNTESADQVEPVVARARDHLLAAYPSVRAKVMAMWMGASERGKMEVRISGPDIDVLLAKAEHLMEGLREIPGSLDIEHDWENKVIKMEVRVDQARARRAGVSSEEVAQSLSAFIGGTRVSDYREGDTVIPIVVRGLASERASLPDISRISIFSQPTGRNVPLRQIADSRGVWEVSRIKRRNQERTITVSAKHQTLAAAPLFERLRPAIDTLDLATGYRYEIGGEQENQERAQRRLAVNMPICFAGIGVPLVWQFNSFRRPIIILSTIPLTFIGVVPGLLLMGATFGFMVILGFLSLAGIIINNGIVLIDRIDLERAAGRTPYDAIIAATVARFRPILMTTLTTILGLTPLIVSRDPLFYGMASAIASGLAIGSVLTLIVVPVNYSLFFRVSAPTKP